jgi:hypothetical protein
MSSSVYVVKGQLHISSKGMTALIAERYRLWFSVDERACRNCSEPMPEAAIEDLNWRVESREIRGVEHAAIFCPKCSQKALQAIERYLADFELYLGSEDWPSIDPRN